jgi:hypothetical protein
MVINEALMCLAAYVYAAVSKYVSRVKRSCCKNNHSLSQSVAQGERKVQKKLHVSGCRFEQKACRVMCQIEENFLGNFQEASK